MTDDSSKAAVIGVALGVTAVLIIVVVLLLVLIRRRKRGERHVDNLNVDNLNVDTVHVDTERQSSVNDEDTKNGYLLSKFHLLE